MKRSRFILNLKKNGFFEEEKLIIKRMGLTKFKV